MAALGGKRPRRRHFKSRVGCETCKRRHIRCDENYPQCRNCTKHNCHCDYKNIQIEDERATTSRTLDMLLDLEDRTDVQVWQETGEFPFPDLYIFPALVPELFSFDELYLIHHLACIPTKLRLYDVGNFTIWVDQIPLFLRIGAACDFVMHALLALSSIHIARVTECLFLDQIAYRHQGIALRGLREAIGVFSQGNSDAVLAASLLLSWQATEWRGWTQLVNGTSSVIKAMQSWRNESQFRDFISQQSSTASMPLVPKRKQLTQPRKQDLEALQRAYGHLQHLRKILWGSKKCPKAISQLMKFLGRLQSPLRTQTAAQRFTLFNPFRSCLFWLPIMYLQQAPENPHALLILAYYYTMALVVEPIFSEVGTAYFGSLLPGPIEAITRQFVSVKASQTPDLDPGIGLALMQYPMGVVSESRAGLHPLSKQPGFSPNVDDIATLYLLQEVSPSATGDTESPLSSEAEGWALLQETQNACSQGQE